MRLLWIATKPPWPPIDGGRLLQALTIESLVRLGCRVDVVAPDLGPACDPPADVRLERIPTPPRRALRLLWRRLGGEPYAIARHRRVGVAAAVDRLASEADVVHVEQIHALAQAPRGLPVVLRAQNVEHELWQASAAVAPRWRRLLLAFEAKALARREAELLRRPNAVIALTAADAHSLERLCGREVTVVPAPFPAELPPGPALAGNPTFALLAGSGWAPNADGACWFVREVWPRLFERRPQARLHVFGDAPGSSAAGVVAHLPPADSRTAFPEGAILVVPLRIASGVRMKILEAWARGVPVLATPAAVEGLPRCAVAVAASPEDLAERALLLADEPAERVALVSAGRERLRAEHSPERVGAQLLALYEELAAVR